MLLRESHYWVLFTRAACRSVEKGGTVITRSLTTTQQLIKKLAATPVLNAQHDPYHPPAPLDTQAALQANKAKFFFQLVGCSTERVRFLLIVILTTRRSVSWRRSMPFTYRRRPR